MTAIMNIRLQISKEIALFLKFKYSNTVAWTKISLLQAIGVMSREFANGPGDRGSISRSSHTKDSKNGTYCRLA